MNIYIDIETIPTQNQSHKDFILANLTPPSNYKNQESINKWIEENKEKAINSTSLDGTFGEIAVISVAINDEPVQTFYREDWESADREKDILERFNAYMKGKFNVDHSVPQFIGHNLSKFDDLFIFQRCVINNVIPAYTTTRNNVYDTMLEWAGYNRDKYVSLEKLCQVLGIEGKGDIDGSKVWEFVQNGKIKQVAEYCEKDVERVRAVYKRMNFME